MKFDFCIGNPPYQEDRKGESKTALPVYHDFMDAAYEVADIVELITPARFLFNAGRTPKKWNEKMLQDEHLKVLNYEQDASKLFANTEIKGGVAITYRDRNKKFGSIGTFAVHDETFDILEKIKPCIEEKGSLSSIAYVASKFNTTNLFADFPEYLGHERRMSSNVLVFNCFHEKPHNGDIMIYGVSNGKRIGRYIASKYVDLDDECLKYYKIITPKADGSGSFGETLSNPEILNPNCGFTHTFLGIGAFLTEEDAQSALKYLKTKFARALLSVLKITQDLNADKFLYIPLQDFSPNSDIDWTKTISAIDQQLYQKYKLSEAEIAFIESHVKEMK